MTLVDKELAYNVQTTGEDALDWQVRPPPPVQALTLTP